VFGIVIGSVALVGEVTRRAFRPQLPSPADAPVASPLAQPAAQRLLGVVQFITAAIAVFVPLAAALYLLVTVAWTLGQRVVLRRRYPPLEA
jgi:YidC/Oxa1 family membrane protein insertase